MKILKFLFILILILYPFGELLRFNFGDNVVLKPIDLTVGITAIIWVILKATNSRKIRMPAWYFIAFPIVGFISLLINTYWLKPHEFYVSLLYLIRWIVFYIMYFVVMEFDRVFKKKITNILMINGLLILLLGFIQYFFLGYSYQKFLYTLGWDFHLHRFFSVFLDPNFTGSFLVLYFIFTGGLLLSNSKFYFISNNSTTKQKSKQNINNLKIYKNIFEKFKGTTRNRILILFLIVTIIAIFLTFSRSALLMLIAATITLLILVKRKKYIFLLFGIILIFSILASPKFYDENMNLFRSASSLARIANYNTSIMIIKDHIFLGVGFNSLRYTKNLYNMKHDWVNFPSHADAGADNSFLFVLATTGMIGFTFYLYLWYVIIRRALLLIRRKSSINAVVVVASVAGLFVQAQFINSLFFSSIMLWIWIVAGLMEE